MDSKHRMLTRLREELQRWEELLAGMSEEQITAPQLPYDLSLRDVVEQSDLPNAKLKRHPPYNLSIKDVVAHLRAWQQRSIAWLEAAHFTREPEFPAWPEGLDPESEDEVDQINAWIYEIHREQPWSSVHRDWREGFLRFLELAEAIPEKDMLEAGKYSWLGGHPLSLVLEASYEHHHDDYLEPLLAWLRQQGRAKPTG